VICCTWRGRPRPPSTIVIESWVIRYSVGAMKTQLFFDLTAQWPCPSIYFRESEEVATTVEELRNYNIAVLEIDGTALSSEEDLFKAFAVALRKPKGWYGDEDYPTNIDAFHEYLDDVVEWVPAKGHVVLIHGSEQFWRTGARLAGLLTEFWQFATISRHASIRLVFEW
jgi:hypothetical protein